MSNNPATFLNPVLANVPILYNLKNQKSKDDFSGLKWEHWPEMV